MKVALYVTETSRPCKIVRDRLDKHNIKYVYHNLTKNGITEVEIRHFLDRTENGFNDILAKRSLPYRRIEDIAMDMTTNEMIEYIIAHPNIIKTPLVYTKDKFMVGYDEWEFELLMKRLTEI